MKPPKLKKKTAKKTVKKAVTKTSASLRKRAEDLLALQNERLRELSSTDLKKLVHELGTHQIELEMQNEELRRAQAEIDSSRRKYADLYDFSPVGYFTIDRNGSIREVNHTGAAMLGMEKRALINRPFQNFIEPAGRAAFREHLDEVFRSQTRQDCEINLKTRKGILTPIQLQSIVADSGGGMIDTCRSAVSDITKLKRAEDDLRVSERRERERAEELAAMLEAVPTPVIIVHDPDSTHMTGNRAADDLLKNPRGAEASLSAPPEVKPRHFRAIKDGRELRLDELPAQRAARGEEVRDFEFSLAFDDGTTKHLLGYGAPLRDEQGRPRGAVHVLVDITGRKQAADALRTSEQRMALFIEHAPASLAMFDRDMRYLSVSRRWMSDYRLGNRELRGISHYDVFPEIPERWRAVIRRALAGEVVRDDSDRFDRTDGTAQWLRWEVRPWYDVAGTVAGIVIFTEEITEQKKTEEALRQSEERYRLLFERAGDAIFILEAAGPRAGAIIEANKTAAEMHGYTIDELRSLRIMDLDAPDTARESPGMITRILNGEWITREIVHRRKDGALFPVELNAGLLQLKERKFILAIDRDITERKRTERERERVLLDLKRRTAELDTMFQALPYLVSVHGPDGRYVRVNPAMISLLGFDPTGAAREDVARRVKARFPDGRLLVPDNMPSSSALAGEAVHDVEYIVTDAQGRDHVLLFNAIPLRVEGHVYGAVLAQMDITERKQAEEALRKAKDLSDVLNRINKAVHSTFDFDEIMRRVITEAGNAIGCDSAAISLRKKDRWVVAYAHGFPQDVAGSHLHEEGQSHAVLALKTSKPVVIEDALHDARLNTEHMKKHSIRSVLIVPLVAGEEHLGAIFFNHHTAAGSFSDAQIDFADKLASTITLAIENARLFEERRRAEERVNNLNEELKRSLFELEAVNIELESFSYSVSHDLRAPLRSIEGFTTAIIEDCAATLDETGRDYFNRIVAASRRMSQLIDAMLHMARLTRSEIREQVVNLSALAEGIVPELKRGQPGRQAAFIIAPELKVQGDTGMLRIVLENLLDNAFKFTNRHRTANIEFGSTEMEGKTVYFVRDDGAGFDMRYADKLFNPFKRLHTESEFPGIGIGLATAHRIISRHNGRIWAESEPEKGATFYFTL